MAPKAPMAEASVGAARPAMMEPGTNSMSALIGSAEVTTISMI